MLIWGRARFGVRGLGFRESSYFWGYGVAWLGMRVGLDVNRLVDSQGKPEFLGAVWVHMVGCRGWRSAFSPNCSSLGSRIC